MQKPRSHKFRLKQTGGLVDDNVVKRHCEFSELAHDWDVLPSLPFAVPPGSWGGGGRLGRGGAGEAAEEGGVDFWA